MMEQFQILPDIQDADDDASTLPSGSPGKFTSSTDDEAGFIRSGIQEAEGSDNASTLPPGKSSSSSPINSDSDDEVVCHPVNKKRKKTHGAPATASVKAFVTLHADRETGHRHQFRIVPVSRYSLPKYAVGSDKLAEYIRKGGGIIDRASGEGVSEENNGHVIKILDLDFVREHVQDAWIQGMTLPFDCFSSSFIWSQWFHRSSHAAGKRNADLNLFRISQTRRSIYDANEVLNGTLSWDKIPLLPVENQIAPTELLQVALLFFPEKIVFSGRTRRIYTRQESQVLLDKVCQLNAHAKVNGISLYCELERNHFSGRSSTSLREHFRKTILPHVLAEDKYYTLSQEDIKKFRDAHKSLAKKFKRESEKRL